MGIREAINAIAAKQEAMVLPAGTFDWHSQPIGINAVYKYGAPAEAETPDAPCWFNSWTLEQVQKPNSTLTETFYDVRMQLAVYDADQNRAAEIASAFMDLVLTAFNTDPTLGGAISNSNIEGASPTLVQFEFNEKCIGLDLHLKVNIKLFG